MKNKSPPKNAKKKKTLARNRPGSLKCSNPFINLRCQTRPNNSMWASWIYWDLTACGSANYFKDILYSRVPLLPYELKKTLTFDLASLLDLHLLCFHKNVSSSSSSNPSLTHCDLWLRGLLPLSFPEILYIFSEAENWHESFEWTGHKAICC